MDELWDLAERQHALFARWQASAAGVGWRKLDTRLRRGDLELWSDRVLRLRGAMRTAEQDLMGAVLDAGPGSVVTKAAGAWLWGVPGFTPGPRDVIRGRGQRPRAGASGRWPRHLPPGHVTEVRGIPVLTLARTVVELCGMREHAWKVGRIIDTIDGKDPSLLIALHTIFPEVATRGKPGIALLRDLLSDRPPDRIRLTGLERRFEWCLSSAGLVVPRRQVDIGGHRWIGRVDYIDADRPILWEIDSAAHHASLLDRLNDAKRDAEALAAGYLEVVRITDEEVWYDPPTVLRKVIETRRKWRNWRAA